MVQCLCFCVSTSITNLNSKFQIIISLNVFYSICNFLSFNDTTGILEIYVKLQLIFFLNCKISIKPKENHSAWRGLANPKSINL